MRQINEQLEPGIGGRHKNNEQNLGTVRKESAQDRVD